MLHIATHKIDKVQKHDNMHYVKKLDHFLTKAVRLFFITATYFSISIFFLYKSNKICKLIFLSFRVISNYYHMIKG